ncbi:MAG: DUF92 domain-containing protein [Chloroflexota bacterium]
MTLSDLTLPAVVVITLAYLAAAVIAYAGYRARALTIDGAVAACLVGGTVFGFGQLGCALLLVLFFASSSLLSFFKTDDARKRRAAETFEKGGKRDAAQVLANGGVAALAALLLVLSNGSAAAVYLGAFVGALAAATADTWATEIGVLSRNAPRLITTGRIVPAGTSGGVTWLGSAAAMLGAGVIGIGAALLAGISILPISHPGVFSLVAAGLIGGTAGMLGDSLLGATVQASYWCPQCNKPTESRIHTCGTPTELRHGLPWLNNDLVNVAGTLIGALVAALIFALTLP